MVKSLTQIAVFTIATIIVLSLFHASGQDRFTHASNRSTYTCSSLSEVLSSVNTGQGWDSSFSGEFSFDDDEDLSTQGGPMTYEYFYAHDIYREAHYYAVNAEIQATCASERAGRQTAILIVIGAALALIIMVGTFTPKATTPAPASVGAPRARAPRTETTEEPGSEEA